MPTLTLRTLTASGFTTKGSALDDTEFDNNFIQLKAEIDSLNTTLAGITAHTQNEDIKLAEGSGDEVSATEIRNTVDNALENIIEDVTPQLGGNLDVNGKTLQFNDGAGDRRGTVLEDDIWGITFVGHDDSSQLRPALVSGSNMVVFGNNIYHRSNSALQDGVLRYGLPITVDSQTLFPIVATPEGGIVNQETLTDTGNVDLSGGGVEEVLTETTTFGYLSDGSAGVDFVFRVTEASSRLTTFQYRFLIAGSPSAYVQDIVDGAIGFIDISSGLILSAAINIGDEIILEVQALDTGGGRTTVLAGATITTTIRLTQYTGTVGLSSFVSGINQQAADGKGGYVVAVNNSEDGLELVPVNGISTFTYMEDNASETALSVGAWAVITGNLSAQSIGAHADLTISGQTITNDSGLTKNFKIEVDVSMMGGDVGSDKFEIGIFKGGSVQLNGKACISANSSDCSSGGLITTVQLDDGEYIETQVRNIDNGSNVTVSQMTVEMHEI